MRSPVRCQLCVRLTRGRRGGFDPFRQTGSGDERVADPRRKRRNPAGHAEAPAGRCSCRVWVKRCPHSRCFVLLLLPWLSHGAESSAPTGAKRREGEARRDEGDKARAGGFCPPRGGRAGSVAGVQTDTASIAHTRGDGGRRGRKRGGAGRHGTGGRDRKESPRDGWIADAHGGGQAACRQNGFRARPCRGGIRWTSRHPTTRPGCCGTGGGRRISAREARRSRRCDRYIAPDRFTAEIIGRATGAQGMANAAQRQAGLSASFPRRLRSATPRPS